MPPENHFAVLGLEPCIQPGADTLKECYHRLAGRSHPDKAEGGSDRFQEIETAYRILSSPSTRLKHLADLAAPQQAEVRGSTPPEFSDFMFELGTFLQKVKSFQTEQRLAGSAVALALLTPRRLEHQEEAMRFEVRISAMRAEMEAKATRLQLNDAYGLRRAASGFTYLERAASQLHSALSALMDG